MVQGRRVTDLFKQDEIPYREFRIRKGRNVIDVILGRYVTVKRHHSRMRLPVGYDTITKKHFIIITRSVATVIVAEPNEIIAALFEVPEDQVVRWKRRLGAGQSDICSKFH